MPIEYQKKGQIAIITINRPEVMNALSLEALRELTGAMIKFRDDPELRVGILTGAGDRAFCTGMDLSEAGEQPGEAFQEVTFVHGLELWKPLIAAINGYALGGGLEIALTCDIRIAADTARLGLPEVTVGLMPGWGGTQRLPRLIPFGKAAEMMLTGKKITAQEALDIFLVSQVVPQQELMAAAMDWAGKICSVAPVAVRYVKEAMIRGDSMTLAEGLNLEAGLVKNILASKDAIEGRQAFMEKRKPNFKGE